MKSQNIQFISVARVLAIHDYAVKRFGGSQGIRDLGLVESAVARPQTAFGGDYMYTTIFEMAAALLQSLLKNHPFVDGNKRTALFSTGIFLQLNGYRLVNQHQEEVEFAVKVDTEDLTIEEIGKWLEKNSVKIS